MRVFDHVRTAAQLAATHRTPLPHDEQGMLAQWSFDELSSAGIVTETVAGNNLTVRHTNEVGFTNSTPMLTFVLNENPVDGTVIGSVTGIDGSVKH
ncbi:MAG: hypothetical protein R3C05_04345 [Pirellulaceae bacterium]